jgi:arsenate reductase
VKKKILFLCTGNSCRSQIAEAYGKMYLSEDIEVYSAGIEKHGLNPCMLQVLKEDNIDISFLYSKTLGDLNNISFDIVITLCGNAKGSCPTYLKKSRILHKGFIDPAKYESKGQEKLGIFRKVRDEIKKYI